jgi:hypothetical protein
MRALTMALLIIAVIAVAVTLTHESSFILSPIGQIKLNTELPKAPDKLPMYKVVGDESMFVRSSNPWQPRDLPSKAEAIEIASKLAEKYGEIPEDAKLVHVETVYVEGYNLTTKRVEKRIPMFISLIYKREINRMPVVGPGGEIRIDLGKNEVLTFLKIWRKLEYVKDVKIISAEEAYEKLKKGEVVNKPISQLKLEIVQIKPGYYAKGLGEQQDYYKPVWIFYCKDELGYNVTLAVEAV